MKPLKIITIFALVICLALNYFSCNNNSSESNKTEDEPKMVTETFEAKFIGTYIHAGPDTLKTQKCTDSLSTWRAIVDCNGTSNLFGDIIGHFDFCGNEKGYYGNTYAYFVDQSNDTFFVSCDGRVVQGRTEEHLPLVTSYWKDDFEIIGGTGKFEGTTGKGKTDDYNSSEDLNSHHHWTGTITSMKPASKPAN